MKVKIKTIKTIKTRPIGDVFQDEKGVSLKVVEGVSFCKGCFYFADELSCNVSDRENTGYCTETQRQDKIDIIFKKIKG